MAESEKWLPGFLAGCEPRQGSTPLSHFHSPRAVSLITEMTLPEWVSGEGSVGGAFVPARVWPEGGGKWGWGPRNGTWHPASGTNQGQGPVPVHLSRFSSFNKWAAEREFALLSNSLTDMSKSPLFRCIRHLCLESHIHLHHPCDRQFTNKYRAFWGLDILNRFDPPFAFLASDDTTIGASQFRDGTWG